MRRLCPNRLPRPDKVAKREPEGPMSRDPVDIEEHLRAASDAILLLLTEAGQLERHKRAIPPGESRFDEVARSVRIAAAALAEFTQQEEHWARVATADRDDLATIEEARNGPTIAE